MNKFLKGIDQESILFFDCEIARRSKELDVDSKQFELFQRKIRNKDTDELLPKAEVVEQYNKKGALRMCYSTIVSIGLAFIKGGEVHMKSIEGTEEEIIRQFCKIASSFDYICGSNVIPFDCPLLINNGYRYFDVAEHLPDRFNTSNRKIWELKSILDLQFIFQGSHYSPSSLDEMCYHFGLPSPKTDIDGSKISDEYWENGTEKISKYVKGDVFACVNLFKKMRFEKPFYSYIDKNELLQEEITIFQRLMKSGILSEEIKNEFREILSESDDNELQKASVLIKAHYSIPKGGKKENKKREEEVDDLIQEISNANYEKYRSESERIN